MLSIFLGLHFALTIAIIGLILIQKHDSDGALGTSGGGSASGMFSVRGQANILTKSTAILMTLFMVNCLVMAKLTKNKANNTMNTSVIDRVAANSVRPAKKDTNETKAESEQTKDNKTASESSSKTDQSNKKEEPTSSKPADATKSSEQKPVETKTNNTRK